MNFLSKPYVNLVLNIATVMLSIYTVRQLMFVPLPLWAKIFYWLFIIYFGGAAAVGLIIRTAVWYANKEVK